MDKFKACVYIGPVNIRRANRVCEAINILQHIQLFGSEFTQGNVGVCFLCLEGKCFKSCETP